MELTWDGQIDCKHLHCVNLLFDYEAQLNGQHTNHGDKQKHEADREKDLGEDEEC